MFDLSNPTHLRTLRSRLSAERLSTFDQATAGPEQSLRLYEWNIEVSSAFHGLLHVVEVVLRNAIHEQLAAMHQRRGRPGTWLDDPDQLLESRTWDDIEEARRRLRSRGKPETPGRIIAELPFGFWRYLLAARYQNTLWAPALRHAFPNLRPARRRDIADRVARLHDLRNRIAHHEPVFTRNLAADYADAIAVLAAVCSRTRGWITRTGNVPTALAGQPA